MTKDEAIQFVQREHALLECSFNTFYPHYDFRWDEDAEIILLDICDKWGKVLKTHAIGYEDMDRDWIYRKAHRVIELWMELNPDWTDVRKLPNGQISWRS
ncbi:hypothetical protein [Succinimonas sp.]|uniref:hypothetical protein n=1 Tax=Succinimonas sp. TaxID=1936151 RepID=UPI003868237E